MVRLDTCKFGDRLRTRDGRMAVFLHKSLVVSHDVYICVIEHGERSHLEMKFWANGKRYFDNEPSEFDILSRFDDNIEYTRRNAPGEPDYLAPILIDK